MYRSQVYSQPYWRTISWKVIIDFYVQWSQNHVSCTRFKCIWVTLVIIHCLKVHLKKSQSKLGTLLLSSFSHLLLTVFCMFVCFFKTGFWRVAFGCRLECKCWQLDVAFLQFIFPAVFSLLLPRGIWTTHRPKWRLYTVSETFYDVSHENRNNSVGICVSLQSFQVTKFNLMVNLWGGFCFWVFFWSLTWEE